MKGTSPLARLRTTSFSAVGVDADADSRCMARAARRRSSADHDSTVDHSGTFVTEEPQ
ncbi:hypothetical protein [Micromonospora sp. NPDC049102]|uniref:hypothetical protein n=1 Tax=Micromonospora sp. NPDC049102 TaxID=3364265 RepID=UPI00371EDBCC